MKNQNGYIDIDLGAIFAGCLVIGAVLGIAVWPVIGWVWPYVKAFIHGITA